MEGNELSYSEYLKCNNACVKVTINRYRGLCSRTVREMCDVLFSLLKEMPFFDLGPYGYCLFTNILMIMYVCLNDTLNQNAWAKAEKCKAPDLSSLKALFRRIVDITKEIDQHSHSLLPLIHAFEHMLRLLQELVARYDPRHPSLRFYRLLMLHNFMFPEVIKAGKLLATHDLTRPYSQRLFQFIEQDFEPEEIDHGSGFLIADNFVVTSWHVIEDAMRDETLVIRILNETIGELLCVVVHCDPSNDLALLYCHDLDLKRHGICPFALSEEPLWPSLSVFSFGYPLTHTENSALFVKGYVSGIKKRYGDNRKPFWVLNCDLNGGNSGSPVLRRIGDDIKVVGVVSQKHKKEILTLEEISILEEERSTLQMNCASDSRDQFWKSVSLKMYDALNETHCQFGYGNVVPGHVVVEFLHDPSVTSIMDLLKETELSNEFDVQG